MTRSKLIAYVLLLCGILCGPAFVRMPQSGLSPSDSLARADSDQATPANQDTNDFAFNLFHQTAQSQDGNVLVSPLSAYLALSMTLNGAAGSTRDQMSQVLGADPRNIEEFNASNQARLSKLAGNDKVQLNIANAVYADSHFPFKQEFIDLCKQAYSAQASDMDFAQADRVVKAINSWCADKTHGKIPTIVDRGLITPAAKMVLLDAIYFKGSWAAPFDKVLTRDEQFTTSGGNQAPIKMMHKRQRLAYLRGSDFQSVSIPYAGGKQHLYVFLPDAGVTLSDWQSKLKKQDWDRFKQSYQIADVNLALPRLKISYSKRLDQALVAMGMADAFSKAADFSNMARTRLGLYLSGVLQKTYMDINEEGTEAAAATAVIMSMRAVQIAHPVIEFRVDRPFLLVLVDDSTGDILFLGSIVEP